MPSTLTAEAATMIDLPVRPLTPDAFAPFGQVILPDADGRPFGPDDAQLDLGRGTPRYYIMTLKGKELAFNAITRHLQVTQCLASVGGRPWLIAVAPPNDPDDPHAVPDPRQIAAFRVPGDAAVMLHRSTWHIGPFTTASASFFNLELSDTNQIDHHPVALDRRFGVTFRFAGDLCGV